jgi:hypothetical protein
MRNPPGIGRKARIAGLAVIGVVFLGLVGTVVGMKISGSERPVVVVVSGTRAGTPLGGSLAAAQSTTPATTRSCSSTLAITSPTDGQQFSGADGVPVSGTACGLADEDGWLFDSDGEDPYYYEVYPNDPGPVVQQNGPWTTIDQPIGEQGDDHKTYYLTLVLASANCDTFLRNMRPIDSDLKILRFPPDCRIAQTVSVVVTYP